MSHTLLGKKYWYLFFANFVQGFTVAMTMSNKANLEGTAADVLRVWTTTDLSFLCDMGNAMVNITPANAWRPDEINSWSIGKIHSLGYVAIFLDLKSELSRNLTYFMEGERFKLNHAFRELQGLYELGHTINGEI